MYKVCTVGIDSVLIYNKSIYDTKDTNPSLDKIADCYKTSWEETAGVISILYNITS